jgi:hypothetical protein
VHCAEGSDNVGIDLRDLVVDPGRPPQDAFRIRIPPSTLHHPVTTGEDTEAVSVTTRPYATWAGQGPSTMRLRFPTR